MRPPSNSSTGASPISFTFFRYSGVRVSPLKKSTKRGVHLAPQRFSISATLKQLPDCAKQYSLYSVVVTGHERAALADEEVEVGALVGLQHVVEVQAPVAAWQRWLGLPPLLFPLGKDFFRD